MRRSWITVVAGLLSAWTASVPGGTPGTEQPAAPVVEVTSLRHKVLCGYQGWFRCPGDPANEGWLHWSRQRSKIAPDTVTEDWARATAGSAAIISTRNFTKLLMFSPIYDVPELE